MTRFASIFTFLILSLTAVGQNTTDTDSVSTIQKVLSLSDVIDGETFNLEFHFRALPDHAWFLRLRKDSIYEYVHWSGWGDPEGTVIENGKYVISKNQLRLIPNKEKSRLMSTVFYLAAFKKKEVEKIDAIDCQKLRSKVYCLYLKS